MNVLTHPDLDHRSEQSEGDEVVHSGMLSRLVLGPSGSRRLDHQLDLLASAWLGVLIGVFADPRAGLLFVAGAFMLTGCSSRLSPDRDQPGDPGPQLRASSPARS